VRSFDWIFIIGSPSGGDWANTWHWAERSTVWFWNRKQQQQQQSQLLPHVLAYRIPPVSFHQKYNVITPWTDHNYNHAIIKNNCGRRPRFNFFFKIPMGTWQNFFEIFRWLGHAPSKMFASTVPERSDSTKNWQFHDPLWVFLSVQHGQTKSSLLGMSGIHRRRRCHQILVL
jgi:hypothetical protein